MSTAASYQGLVDHLGRPLPLGRSGSSGPSALSKSYHNASRDRTRSGTRGPLGSVNAHHDKRTLDDLIRDCSALSRNSIISRAIINTGIDHVVGEEVLVNPLTSDKDWNKETRERFHEWCDQCDNTDQLSMTEIAGDVVKSWFTTGAKIAHKVIRNGRYCRLEMIDAVRLMNEAGRPDTKDMIGGVQIDTQTNRPIKYWIADWNEQGTALDYDPKPHDATHLWMINNPRLQEAGQLRTAPRFAAAIDKIEALEVASKSTMGAYQLATFMALFITRQSTEGISTREQLARAMVDQGYASNITDALERGPWQPMSVMEGLPGEGIEQIKPEHPTTGFENMFWTELMTICAEQGYPLELVFMRFIRNWSASRSAISVAWKKIKKDQKALVRRFLKPVYHWWLANEIRQDRIRALPGNEWKKCAFVMPSMPVLDPKQETEAWLMQLSGGIKRHSEVLIENGQGDRSEFMPDFIDEAESNLAAGLEYGQPTQTTRSEQVIDEEGTSGAKDALNA